MTDIVVSDVPTPGPDDVPLFDLAPLPETGQSQDQKLSATQRLTLRNADSFRRGIHPATGQRLREPVGVQTCGSCVYHVVDRSCAKPYHKCARHRLGVSASAASDIRVSWPACTLFEARDV